LNLPGPEFLAFYAIFAAVVIAGLYFGRRHYESAPPPDIEPKDPYLFAYLRGGPEEAVLVATLALIDRGLLVNSGRMVSRFAQAQPEHASRRIEAVSILAASGCGLLLDLHNLHANATNFGFDPLRYLDEIRVDRVGCMHIAGGRWIKAPTGNKRYLLDDHLHEVAQPVYDLLAEVAARTAQPLTVVLERDGAYPPMSVPLEELDRARRALAAGRRRRAA
jgi:uncharacterized protein (UPF0276 family)